MKWDEQNDKVFTSTPEMTFKSINNAWVEDGLKYQQLP